MILWAGGALSACLGFSSLGGRIIILRYDYNGLELLIQS